MTDLTQQLDAMFTREHLERNKYLLKNLDPNLNLPIVTIQNEYSLGKPTIEELLAALRKCKNCRLHEGYVTLLIPPHTKNIIINEITQTNADFKAHLIEKYLKGIDCDITFEGGCCRVTFKDDEIGLKFLDQAVNDPKDPLKAYVELENVHQSLTKSLGYPNQAQYIYQYNNQMFQNLYIRKASDDVAQQGEKPVKPYYPPVQQTQQAPATNARKQSGSDRKSSEQYQEQQQEKKTKTPKTGPKEIYVEKAQVEKQQQHQEVKQAEKPPKVHQSPYVEKKSNSRKTSEQIYVPKHKGSKDIVQTSPIKKATVQYKKENLVEIFKQIQGNLKVNGNLSKLNEQDRALLLRQNGEVSLEIIHPTPCLRKESVRIQLNLVCIPSAIGEVITSLGSIKKTTIMIINKYIKTDQMTSKSLLILLLVTMALATDSPALQQIRNKLDQNEYNSQLVDMLELSVAGGQLDKVFELLQKMIDDLTGQINAANLEHASRMAAFSASIDQLEANLASLQNEVQTTNRQIGEISQSISTLTTTSVSVKKQLETINQREEQIRDNRTKELQSQETKQAAGSKILAALEEIHDRLVRAVISHEGSFLEESERQDIIKQIKKELGHKHPLALLLEVSAKFDEATARKAIELLEQIISSIKEGQQYYETNKTQAEENFNSLVNEVNILREKLGQDSQKTTSTLKNKQNDLKIAQRRVKQLSKNQENTQSLLETTRVQSDLYDSNFRSNSSKREGQLNALKTALQILKDNEQALKK